MNLTNIKNVAIIGTGVAGLSTAKALLNEGIDCTLFERNANLGGVWADGYYSFGVQVQRELYEFPDWPLPSNTPDFTPGPVIQEYLTKYAEHHGVTSHIRFNCTVEALKNRNGSSPAWTVVYRNNSELHEDDFDLVVICIGLYSNVPNMPEFPGQERFTGEIMHISRLKSLKQVEGKRVAVVGFGKSATDAAVETAAVASETAIIFRRAHWPVPRKLAGILPFKWGMLNRMTSTLIPLYYRPSPLERLIHSAGKPLVWGYWRLVELLLFIQCRLGPRFGARTSMVPDEPVEVGSFGEATMLPRPEFYRFARSGKIRPHRTGIREFTPNGLVLEDGTRLDIDVAVFGTGWRTDYSALPEDALNKIDIDDDGFYLYRHMLHPDVPNLVFIGSASTICSILTYNLQARWLVDLIKGRHRLPSRDAILHDIEDMRTWKRRWMPFSHARGARLILHMLHYHDDLLRDIGANPKRKTGLLAPLKELIAPYEPGDYKSIVSGAWRHEDSGAPN